MRAYVVMQIIVGNSATPGLIDALGEDAATDETTGSIVRFKADEAIW